MGPISKSSITEDELVNFPNSKYADPVFSWLPSIGITDIEFLNSAKLGDKYTNNIFVGDIVILLMDIYIILKLMKIEQELNLIIIVVIVKLTN